ncbi:MAG TPA: glycosyltransferase family 1 protein [Longimicrobiales bacterium]
MRIGVDASCWVNRRGYGRFARELLAAMVAAAPEHEFVCLADPWAAELFDLRAPNVTLRRVSLGAAPASAASADGYRSPLDMLRLTRAVWRERLDVFFSPSVYTYFPLPPGLPALVAVHDTIAERFPELTLPSPRARLFWRAKVGLALRQSTLVLTVSHFSARDLTAFLGVPPGRIRVAIEAPAAAYRPSDSPADIQRAAAALGLPAGAEWIVYVGGFNPHKRLDAIVRAHAAALAAHPGRDLHLLLVGDYQGDNFHSDVAGIRTSIASAGTGERVHWCGFLPDDQLRHIHSGALALLIPSTFEGFGLPAVEAAACGAPVIATEASPLPEILEGAGIFVPPSGDEPLVAALNALLDDPGLRRRLGERALERARSLSWERAARVTLDALAEAAAGWSMPASPRPRVAAAPRPQSDPVVTP